MQLTADPRRADRERRYKPPPPSSAPAEDLTTDYMNILALDIFLRKVCMYNRKRREPEAKREGSLVIKKKEKPFMGFCRRMVFSMCGLMMRLKWCAWTAVFCSSISFANSRVSDDTKQIISSFMLSISAVAMSYLQNPVPMSPPWASLTT